MQLTERDHVAAGLLDPVATGDAEIEQALAHVLRNLLRPQDADFVDTRVDDVSSIGDYRIATDPQIGRLEQLERGFLE